MAAALRHQQPTFGDLPGTIVKPAPWATTPGMYISGRAAIDEVDALAHDLEAEWGVGRLRLLVGVELREKFDRQRYLFNAAIWHGDLATVQRESGRMATAWRVLDRTARANGAAKPHSEAWEARMPDGAVMVVAKDNASARAAIADGRALQVWTLEEIANVLAAVPSLGAVKQTFPGAKVVEGRPYPDDPLDSIRDSDVGLDDELPF